MRSTYAGYEIPVIQFYFEYDDANFAGKPRVRYHNAYPTEVTITPVTKEGLAAIDAELDVGKNIED